ncbi:hypothetical protein ACWT_1661 [Actinoplanes sp. SE50]|uniref:hypothetical protein n=1 Tax=unclassified Actinoplanes TaxID=2626549 RepID=UPI00023ECE13|nr:MULTISPECIES: hypothetical protein [unclassified Actinoplanes]AEV82680.1 hypothetical protein ACPL_1783 [Actinoplanes sp. SE50/110]ATO81076.1 hypothetical protein ACWT_1661 [Actinoplanes sp. SE50]SLL98483.1 hypothetical protein ACSP50_1709 [Actinoplanes sp. SE50/110]
MSKERARRRAERLVVLEREKAARARKVARRQRRRALLNRLRLPRLGSDGRLYHRSRRQRIGIVLVPLIAIAAVWILIPDPALRILLTVLIVLAAPAMVVVALGRRS